MSAFGTKQTSEDAQRMSAFGGKAEIQLICSDVRFGPKPDTPFSPRYGSQLERDIRRD
jgi:hypothetical protein